LPALRGSRALALFGWGISLPPPSCADYFFIIIAHLICLLYACTKQINAWNIRLKIITLFLYPASVWHLGLTVWLASLHLLSVGLSQPCLPIVYLAFG
jgi:hypothetical protein